MIFAFLLLTTFSLADTLPPVTIHLELGKDTLALAEPVLFTIEITNNLDSNIYLNTGGHHSQTPNEIPFIVPRTLILPDGKEWQYRHTDFWHELYYGGPRFYILTSGVRFSYPMILWWDKFIPEDCKMNLWELPCGEYKLCVEKCINISDSESVQVYSDTVEFAFTPPSKKEKKALRKLNALHHTCRHSRYRRIIRRVVESETAYSEATLATHVTEFENRNNVADFEMVKQEFDLHYSESGLQIVLIQSQLWSLYLTEAKVSRELIENPKYTKEQDFTQMADSLNQIMEVGMPFHLNVLMDQGKIGYSSKREIWGNE